MASYGEIVEPVSRTAWEDWDDVPSQTILKLQWQQNEEIPEIIDSVHIYEGKYLYDCISKQTKFNLELINSIKEVSLYLYRIASSNQYICLIKDYNLLQSSEIVDLLKPYLRISNEVVAVQTKPLAEYQSFELSNQDCVIRTVYTSNLGSGSYVQYPKLEQPNMISGVSAGATCLREHLGLSGAAIICYVEHPEEYQVEEIHSLLKKLNIVPVNLKPSNVLNSNLYI